MIELKEFVREDGTSPFGQWFDKLNIPAATQITVALTRLKEGKHSRVKPVGRGYDRFWSRISHLFRERWRKNNNTSLRRAQKTTAKRYQSGRRVLAKL
jgi:hypothetical protein